MNIGDNIRAARKALKMSQDDLAEAIGANRVTISHYEKGTYYPSISALNKLASVLNTTPNALIGEEPQQDKWDISEQIRCDPNLRLLFDQAKKATPEHIRAAAAMLKSLEGEKND